MPKTTARLVSVSVLILSVSIIGTILGLIFDWHTQLGTYSTNVTIGDLAAVGSVTSIPLAPLIALVFCTLLARSRRWWGTVGVVGLCLLALIFIGASVAEVEAPFVPSYPRGVLLTSVTVYIILGLALLISGMLELLDRVRRQRSATRRRGGYEPDSQ